MTTLVHSSSWEMSASLLHTRLVEQRLEYEDVASSAVINSPRILLSSSFGSESIVSEW